jgi:hypothetical protein
MVVVVIKNIKNLKKDKPNEVNKKKDNMFTHILINAVFNIIYCFIMMFKVISLCLHFTSSLFCSSIATELPAQSFKIIFIEFMGNVAKICCNVSYTAISISRIFLTGESKYKGCCANKFKNLNIIIYVTVLLIVSSILSIFKLFVYKLNRMSHEFNILYDYPMTTNNLFTCNEYIYNVFSCLVWEIFKIVNSILNDILLFLVTIIFDIIVLKNVSEIIKSKKKMIINFKEAEEEKKRNKF